MSVFLLCASLAIGLFIITLLIRPRTAPLKPGFFAALHLHKRLSNRIDAAFAWFATVIFVAIAISLLIVWILNYHHHVDGSPRITELLFSPVVGKAIYGFGFGIFFSYWLTAVFFARRKTWLPGVRSCQRS